MRRVRGCCTNACRPLREAPNSCRGVMFGRVRRVAILPASERDRGAAEGRAWSRLAGPALGCASFYPTSSWLISASNHRPRRRVQQPERSDAAGRDRHHDRHDGGALPSRRESSPRQTRSSRPTGALSSHHHAVSGHSGPNPRPRIQAKTARANLGLGESRQRHRRRRDDRSRVPWRWPNSATSVRFWSRPISPLVRGCDTFEPEERLSRFFGSKGIDLRWWSGACARDGGRGLCVMTRLGRRRPLLARLPRWSWGPLLDGRRGEVRRGQI